MSHPTGDSESLLRYHSMSIRRRKYDSPITRREYGKPSNKFKHFCAGEHENNEEYARRINRGFKTIGEEHHEKATVSSKYTVCESWDHWDC